MINFQLLKKIALFTLFFFIWFSFTGNFNYAEEGGEDIFKKAKKLYKEGFHTKARKIFYEFVKKNKERSDKKKEVAEAYYLMAKIYYMASLGPNIAAAKYKEYRQKVSEYLTKAFDIYEKLDIEEKDPEFIKIVENVRKRVPPPPPPKVIPVEGKKNGKRIKWYVIVGAVVVVGVVALLLLKKKKKKKYTLTVTVGEGVQGNPSSGSTTYEEGTTVSYNYSLQSGYTDLVVTLDENVVASSGTITMDRNHQLNAVTTELGSIYVTSTPTGANIYLDGADTGKLTNAVISDVVPGTHTIRLTLQGYNTEERTVEVVPGEETRVDIPLNKSYEKEITIPGKLGTKSPGQKDNTGQDAYKFYVAANCTLTITVTYNKSHSVPEFALFANDDASGRSLVKGKEGDTLSYTISTTGQYYSVAIEDERHDDLEKAGDYTIKITSNVNTLGDYVRIKDEAPENSKDW